MVILGSIIIEITNYQLVISNVKSAIILICLSSPLVLDGILQYSFGFESTNRRRILTGLLFGNAIILAALKLTSMSFSNQVMFR